MSVFAVTNRSLYEFSRPLRAESPHRASGEAVLWRELPAAQTEPAPVLRLERLDEDCERWDGLS
jgi:hypothetical protein